MEEIECIKNDFIDSRFTHEIIYLLDLSVQNIVSS